MPRFESDPGLSKEEQLAGEVERRYRAARDMKSELHDQWWTNHAFYDGKHYVTYRSGRPQEPKAPSWRVRLTNNLIHPIVNTISAKLTQQRPGWVGRPGTPDDAARQKARASEHLLDFLYRNLSISSITFEVVWNAVVYGTGFFNTYWEPSAQEKWEVAPGEIVLTGMPRVECWSPFDVYPDPEGTQLSSCKWVILVHTVSEETVEARWPGILKSVLKQRLQMRPSEDEEQERRREFRGYMSGSMPEHHKQYRIYEYQERPTEDYPEGRRILTSHGVLLEETELPGQRFSLHMVRVGEMADRLWGTGVVKNVIPLQKELNRTISSIVELRNLASQPPWVVAQGSVAKNGIKNRPDHVIQYNPNLGPAPRRVEPVPIPASLYELTDSMKTAMWDVSGVHEVSQGRNPSGVVSGRAIGMLSDQDSTKLGPAARSLENAMESLGCALLMMWKTHMDQEVSITALGQSKRPEVMKLHADMVGTDVEIISGSMLVKHPSFEREQALQVLQVGGFGPMEDPETLIKFRKAYGSYGLSEFYDDDTADRNYARQENDFLKDEVMRSEVKVSWWENHLTHVDEHLACMKDPEFREQSFEVQEAMSQHLAEHYRQLQMQQQGLPTYTQAYGEDPMAQMQQQQQPQEMEMGGMPPDMGGMPPEMMMEPVEGGLVGGGTPELNAAIGPEGPGVNTLEEATGVY